MDKNDLLPIGDLARRTGLAVSAIRFYEDKGLVQAMRTMGNQRRFLRSDIRRLSFILIAQKLGLGLVEIEAELSRLPQGRTPNQSDWARLSRSMRSQLDAKKCTFKTGKVVLQQPVDREQVKKLLATGKTDLLTQFISKAGKPFPAHLKLAERGKVEFEFPDR